MKNHPKGSLSLFLRHHIENAFQKLKRFRALPTRYDRLKVNDESTVALACWLLCCHYAK